MANAGASIEAVLSLNATSFNQGITSSIEALSTFEKSIGTFRKNTSSFDLALRNLQSSLHILVNEINLFNIESKKLAEFSKFATSVNKVSNALRTLSSSEIDAVQSMNLINNMFRAFQGSLNGVEVKVKGVSTVVKELASSEKQSASATQQVAVATQQYDKALELALPPTRNLITSTRELANSQNQLQSEERETASATDQATNSMNRQASATSRLGKAMSSLRMMGTMVGSMMVYNLAHNLITATRETVNAKSEMNGYFQMLGYTSGEVEHFNGKLDEMIQKFPRINKYALGETISSIGVEFELTTQEMEKAMPVVSMITSEYLRAGRNVNEASLAVKDILQGEFQRLSRETGVKGEQLKEAGWSGDKNDVMGLLEALDKVGKSRNWDVFVAKANSLNDAVIILQNRFGEWSADMVARVQPAIVGVFNTIMSLATVFGDVLNGAMDWLSGEGIGQGIVKWGGLATALITVTGALIHYRTGANLTQIAQMGLTKSIGASILGLEAETVAESGLRNAIVQTITGLEAETIAEDLNVSQRRARILAITSTITGLEAEEVAQIGVTKSLGASVLGLDMAIVKEEGFAVALAHSTTQMEVQELKAMGLIKQIALIGATTLPAIAVIGAFAVAVGTLAMKTMDATTKMSHFYDIQQHGEEYVNDAKDSVQNLKDKISELTETQKKYTKGSAEYNNVGKAIDDLNSKVELANQNVDANYEAWQRVNSAQKNYDTRKQELQLELQQKINKSLVDTGLSVEEANELSNTYLNEAIDGSNQLYEALQTVAYQYEKQAEGVDALTKYWQDKGLTPEEIKMKVDPYIDSSNNIIDDIEKMELSTDMVEIVATWGKLEIDQWDHSWKENLPKIESGDILGGLEGLGRGLLHFFADLPILKDFWGWIFDTIGLNNYKGQGWSAFGNMFKEGISNLFNFDSYDGSLQEQFGKWLSDSVNSIDIMGMLNDILLPFGDIDLWSVLSNIGFLSPVSASDGSSDHPSFMEDLSDILGFDVQQWITDFQNDPLGTLGVELPDIDLIGTFIDNLFNNNTESGEDTGVKTFDFSWIPQAIYDSVKNALETWVGDIDIVGFITNLIPSNVEGIYQWAMDNIINPLVDGVKQGILNTPILGDVASLLGVSGDTETSSEESGQTVGTSFTTGIQTGLAPLDGVINSAFQGLNLDSITSNFTSNTSTMVSNATSTATSVGASFLSMKNNHKSSVDSMVNNNTTAFRDMQTKSNTQMLAMRDSTSNVTKQMTDAWSLMKDSIIASATKIKNDSKSRFDTLGQTIGGFYKKIQNPSLWGGGAGYGSTPRRVARKPSVGKALVRGVRTRGGYAGGLDSKSTGATMSVAQLKKQLCPSGECGSIFDGYKSTDEVNVWEFLQGISGEHGLGGWNFAEPHNTFIKNKSDAWGTAPPIIDLVGGINTSTGFKVGEFNNGTPKVSFSTFEQIATAIFSRIPYRLYFDSSWKGSWLGALQSGACNCYDGALALMALARTFGFSGSMAHGTWTDPSGKKTAHVWAVINGVKMDTTGMQQRGTWRPSASAGGSPTGSSDSKTVNVTVDMQGATIYGVDDLDSRIQDSVQKGLQAEFNDPYTMAI